MNKKILNTILKAKSLIEKDKLESAIKFLNRKIRILDKEIEKELLMIEARLEMLNTVIRVGMNPISNWTIAVFYLIIIPIINLQL